ncbi:hypothetical protein AKJ09_00951 [Labilithrix luteola]|uniref:LTD domain-containing protein n=1 Tax=Labilithrix luteola TaxID=1391654 RepID=A0A0K1PL96_9BACT|nr:hypothetical protein AKJ09_00951 [Labilithrix luteola]
MMLVGAGAASLVLPVLVLALLAPACANGTDADLGGSEETNGDASTSGRGDSSVLPSDKDGGSGGNGTKDGAAEGGGGGPSGCTTKLVINEVLVEGTNNAEFVELYNPNACDVDFSGWEVRYLPKSPASSADGTAFFKAGNGATLKGGKFYLLGAGDIGVTPDKTFNGTLGNAGGQIALVDESGSIVDAVGWGATGKYTEGTAAKIATPGKSIGRHPDGADTDDNQSDFAQGDVTPGASNGS